MDSPCQLSRQQERPFFPKPRPVGKSSLASNWFHPASSITLVYSQTASKLETGSLSPPVLLLLKSAPTQTVSYRGSELMCQPALQLALIWKLAFASKGKHLTANCWCQIDVHLIWKSYLSKGTFSLLVLVCLWIATGTYSPWTNKDLILHLTSGAFKYPFQTLRVGQCSTHVFISFIKKPLLTKQLLFLVSFFLESKYWGVKKGW